jgi:hypothetical protein
MALPTEQEFAALKNSIQELQQAQADKWIRDISLVIVGAVAGTIPTISVAIISNRWSKKLFFLTRSKEESVFKSKLYGEIRIVEGNLLSSSHKYISAIILWQYYMFRHHASDLDKKVNEFQELSKYQREKEANEPPFNNSKLEFIRLVSEYNYFEKDEELESLLAEFELTTLTIDPELTSFTNDELFGDKSFVSMFIVISKSYSNYRSKINSIVEYIRKNKS